MSHNEGSSHSPTRNASSWRSRGWIPLAYPKSALEANATFPMHKAVLRAALRELLILDGSLDASTLKFSTMEPVSMLDSKTGDTVRAPRYLHHQRPLRFKVIASDEGVIEEASKAKNNMKVRRTTGAIDQSTRKKQKLIVWDAEDSRSALVQGAVAADVAVPSAESVVDGLIGFALQDGESLESTETVLTTQEDAIPYQRRLPRKVSDSDNFCNHAEGMPPSCLTERAVGPTDVSRFVHLQSRHLGGCLRWKRFDEIPHLFEASIATETTLRETAFGMTSAICQSFTDHPLQQFLGYRTSVRREGLLRVLSDFLFDCSHALFAFAQTEMELENRMNLPLNERDKQIKDSLFDARALKKIGGFESSSLLPHAISVARLDQARTTWEDFSKTPAARVMFQHHSKPCERVLVGQRRRGQRQRHHSTKGIQTHKTRGQSSRSALWVPSDTDGTASSEEDIRVERLKVFNVPSALEIQITRSPGTTWGVLLARESNLCVVVRGSAEKNERAQTSELRSGDIILHIENDRGQSAWSPSYMSTQDKQPGKEEWFRTIVDMFKTSDLLTIKVHRVDAT